MCTNVELFLNIKSSAAKMDYQVFAIMINSIGFYNMKYVFSILYAGVAKQLSGLSFDRYIGVDHKTMNYILLSVQQDRAFRYLVARSIYR